MNWAEFGSKTLGPKRRDCFTEALHYIRYMSNLNEWGDHLELATFASLYNIHISVFQPSARPNVQDLVFEFNHDIDNLPHFVLRYTGAHYDIITKANRFNTPFGKHATEVSNSTRTAASGYEAQPTSDTNADSASGGNCPNNGEDTPIFPPLCNANDNDGLGNGSVVDFSILPAANNFCRRLATLRWHRFSASQNIAPQWGHSVSIVTYLSGTPVTTSSRIVARNMNVLHIPLGA